MHGEPGPGAETDIREKKKLQGKQRVKCSERGRERGEEKVSERDRSTESCGHGEPERESEGGSLAGQGGGPLQPHRHPEAEDSRAQEAGRDPLRRCWNSPGPPAL